MWILKECSRCKTVKELKSFSTDNRNVFGVEGQCKDCRKEYHKQYRKDNKERIKEYRKANKERKKEYYKSNKEKLKEYGKEYSKDYYKANKEKIGEKRKKYKKVNKEKIKEYTKEYYKKPFNRYKKNVRGNVSESFKRKSFTKNSRTKDILGMSIIEFRKHIEKQFTKGMTFDNHGDWHLDHIVPLDYATTEEEVLKLCHYSNYQPLWANDNISKGNNLIPLTNLHFKETFND